jgi:hypothetical protein
MLPGVASETNAELTILALNYATQRDVRLDALKEEVELKNKLLAMMGVLKLTSYHDEEASLSITLETKTKVKVRIGAEDDGEE